MNKGVGKFTNFCKMLPNPEQQSLEQYLFEQQHLDQRPSNTSLQRLAECHGSSAAYHSLMLAAFSAAALL